ncbi:MAG TPA: coproporphyrinogen-III oxidase family protein, partial [Kofleriaceae bacterium]|nr:coproporphyrinogen-III oxidase family protein [Kofleriaceae bacterium]
MDLGVYVHFPWCRKVCPYCDFAVEVGPPQHAAYLRAISSELEARASAFDGHELVSIYFGGGTPALWEPECLAEVIAGVHARFGGIAREVTLEANPTDCDDGHLAAWRAAGVTRLSIGVQSLAPDELVVLGRDHRFGDGPAALARVLAGGGLQTSCDFILGTPTGRAYDTGWIDAIAAPSAQGQGVDHLSVYELTIEERTAFGQRVKAGRLVPRDDDTLADLYIAAHDALTARGFEHYEISSYARPGKRAVHNSLYWRGAPFLGLGVGAASLELQAGGGAARATNPRRAAQYLAAPGVPAEVMTSTAAELAAERAWLGMRTSDGVAEEALPGEIASWLVSEGLAERREARICPTL